eukprot:1277690-Prymnesium_polylepis.1
MCSEPTPLTRLSDAVGLIEGRGPCAHSWEVVPSIGSSVQITFVATARGLSQFDDLRLFSLPSGKMVGRFTGGLLS